MTTENNLFAGHNDNKPQEVSGEDALKLLVGEGAKYQTVEELAKAMVHSQQHIQTIESENAQYKEGAQKQASIQEVLDAIKGQQTPPAAGGENNGAQDQPPATPPAQEPVDIDAKIAEALAQRSQADKAEQNKKQVLDTLSSKLGAEAATAYAATAKRLGVNLDELASTSPEAVISLVAGTTTPSTDTPAATQKKTSGLGLGRTAPVNAQNPLSYKAIQQQFAEGKISRNQKHQLETDGLLKLGSDEFWK